jgi:AcrR family transcriptional regulator
MTQQTDQQTPAVARGTGEPSRPPGRPRSERAEKAIIDATIDLLVEEGGVAGVSIEAVASRACVGKTTIYRRWPNKEALIVEALASLKEPIRAPLGVSVRDDLIAIGTAFMVEKGDSKRIDCYWSVMGAAEKHPELVEKYIREVVEPRREIMRDVLRRGIAEGTLRDDLDIEVTQWLITGAIAHRAKAVGAGPVPADFAASVVDTLLAGLKPCG